MSWFLQELFNAILTTLTMFALFGVCYVWGQFRDKSN